jgi:hypothetical protein
VTFITRIDLSDDRQIKQYENTLTTLSGSVNIFQYLTTGLTDSEIKKGVDESTSGCTAIASPEIFFFTGTTGSTTYYGINPRYNSIIPHMPIITNTNYNQNFESHYFDSIQNVVVDGRSYDILFSGAQFNFDVQTFVFMNTGSTQFSGYVATNWVFILSGKTYNWYYLHNGSSTWINNKGRISTEKLDVDTFTPSASTAVGIQGTMSWDSNYIYICISGNTWKRSALSSF